MLYSWLFIILAIVIIALVAAAALRFYLEKPIRGKKMALIAHTSTITALPDYKKAEKKYHRLLILATILFTICVTSITALAARPVSVTEEEEDYEARDIMICADFSGSMTSVSASTLKYIGDLVDGLKGERVGITLFDGAPLMFMPLTNDYDAIHEQVDIIAEHMDEYEYAIRSASGSNMSYITSSAIGCINNFDKAEDTERSRALILITDGMNGEYNNPLVKVGAYAKEKGVILYGVHTIDASTYSSSDAQNRNNFREYIDKTHSWDSANVDSFYEAATMTGGSYQLTCLDSEEMKCADDTKIGIETIVNHIMDQEASRTKGATQLVRSDAPSIPAVISIISFLALLVVIWRLKL